MMLWGKRRDSGLYTTPAGKLNPGEAPEACAVRELFEETGLRAVSMQKLGISAMVRANVHCFALRFPRTRSPRWTTTWTREVGPGSGARRCPQRRRFTTGRTRCCRTTRSRSRL